MRDRLTGTLILIYALIMMIFSVITLSNAHGQPITKSRKIDKLPTFSYNTIDGQKFSDKDLKNNTKLMIVYFNPLCEVCQKEVKEILSNIDFFNNIQILMISPNSRDEIANFVTDFKLNNFRQITILHDMNDQFYKEFNAIGYPSLYLYDENKVLLEHFDSQVYIGEIKDAFNAESVKK